MPYALGLACAYTDLQPGISPILRAYDAGLTLSDVIFHGSAGI